ncbi:MAG: hypothetical protein AAF226_09890 [Verrucomicrobiota bacterium]
MSEAKKHGMTGKANASKGRKNWPKKTLQIDPAHLSKISESEINLTNAVDIALRKSLAADG